MPIGKSKSYEAELVEPGKYLAVIVGVYDLGHQPPFKPGDRPNHQVLIQYELHDRRTKETVLSKKGYPMLITEYYGLTMGRDRDGNKTKLRAHVEEILDREFTEKECEAGYDLADLLDRVCELKIGHKLDKQRQPVRHVIEMVSPVDAKVGNAVKPDSNAIVYDIDPDAEIDEAIPEWIRNKIMGSIEWTESHNGSGRSGRRAAAQQASSPARARAGRGDEDDESEEETRPRGSQRGRAGAAAGSRAGAADGADIPF